MTVDHTGESRYRTLIEHSTEAVYVVRDGRIVYLNPAAVRLFRAPSAAALLGTDILDRIHPEDQPLALSRRSQVLVDGIPAPLVEMRFIALDGFVFEVEVQATAIDFDGPATYAAARDITVRRQLESRVRQAEKLESVGQLAGGVAHDFNTALAIILGHVQFALLDGGVEASMRADLEAIQGAAQRAAALTRQLLAYARQEESAPQPLDLNAAVTEALPKLRSLVGDQVRLALVQGEELWSVALDPTQFAQAMAALCANARDAIDGPGTITITTSNHTVEATAAAAIPGTAPGDYVRLAVHDDGRGMAPAVQAKVFDPFFTTKDVGEGTGLGLATVYGIVMQHRGVISVESEVGEGTTFTLLFPRHLTDAAQAAPASQALVRPRGRETILIVEDEPAILQLTERTLLAAGYQILVADTADTALQVAARHHGQIDLLLTDVLMPVMTGPDLARELRTIRPDTRVLFMSGFSADHLALSSDVDPAPQLISKPFTLAEITTRVREVLDAPMS